MIMIKLKHWLTICVNSLHQVSVITVGFECQIWFGVNGAQIDY